jgi:hypothetical protein
MVNSNNAENGILKTVLGHNGEKIIQKRQLGTKCRI